MTKEGMFLTLGMAALLHQTDEAVRATAKRLCEYASGSFRKATLIPLANSKEALDIVVEQVLNATDERVVGTLWFEDSEYDLSVRYQGKLWYDVDELIGLAAEWFLRRGVCTGRVYFSLYSPHNHNFHTSSIDLGAVSKDSISNYLE